MLWADNVILLAASTFQLTRMIADVTFALPRFGFEWKESSFEYMKLGCDRGMEAPLIVPAAGPRGAQGGSSSASQLQLFEQERHTNEQKVLPHIIKLKQVMKMEILGPMLDRDFRKMKEMEKNFGVLALFS
eukprot:3687684-Pyramimonas_sp.AAC.1